MIQFKRPAVANDFDAKVKAHRTTVAAAIKSKQKPEFADAWKHFKAAFSHAQHLKCGYCEAFTANGQPGDVEHVAPKSELRLLSDDPAEWGKEVEEGVSNLAKDTRVGVDLSAHGYWWRAYEWDNYLFACTVCNSKYKLNYYPLDPKPTKKGWKPTQKSKKHTPLLLSCFDDVAPWRHFDYARATGQITGTTPRGTATVATCGLFRETLRRVRFTIVRQVYGYLERIVADPNDDWFWKSLVELGGDDRMFAGAVRSIAERELNEKWSQIEARAAAPP